MGLLELAPELLEQIIFHATPEGFDGLILTCRYIYVLCKPFIKRHNELRFYFQNLTYRADPDRKHDPKGALDLIGRIAADPKVARYVKTADFRWDGLRPHILTTNELVPQLLANSSHLQEAGIDWEEYYEEIDEDAGLWYSQNAAVFLLTLLPNVESIQLPHNWISTGATDRILEIIARKAKSTLLSGNSPSLSLVSDISMHGHGWGRWNGNRRTREQSNFGSILPFLGLPCLTSFSWNRLVTTDNVKIRDAFIHSFCRFGESLKSLSLYSSCVDAIAIEDILKNTPQLKSFTYDHRTKIGTDDLPEDWDVSKFVGAIACTVGSHLEELSLDISHVHGMITPKKPSRRGLQCLRGFRHLSRFEIHLDLVACGAYAAACRPVILDNPILATHTTDQGPDHCELSIFDFAPASIIKLQLITEKTDHHAKSLEVLFSDFADRKKLEFPALTEISLAAPRADNVKYQNQCKILQAEFEKAGVDWCDKYERCPRDIDC